MDNVHAAARAAGMVTNPSGTERLHEYWVHGPGAEKIRWGSPGDFDRCVRHLGKFIKDPKGYCNLAHHAALGFYPATHAAMEKKATGRSSTVADSKKPYGDVKYADPKNGKYPLDTEKHIRAAWSYINMPDNAAKYPLNGVTLSEVKARIKAAMDKLGADVASGNGGKNASRSVTQEIRRDCQLEDIHIVRAAEGDSSGRVVEAYATVFDQPVNIRDEQGHYNEIIDRAAFNQILAHIRRTSSLAASVKVLYNHGKTMEGVPAPEFQKPLGKPVYVEPESRGLLTRTEYSKTPLGDEVLELVRSGAITNQSFVGGCIQSDPELRGHGDRYRARNGALTTVRRMVMGLREYGPVLWAAYSGAEILGVRSQLPGASDEALDSPEFEESVPVMEEDGTGGVPEDTTSARYHQHALYRMRSEELREKAGLAW